MKQNWKVFYRLPKRSWEWWNFQHSLLRQVEELKPDLVVVTGILPINSEIFLAVKNHDGLMVNYLTDDPWNPIHKRQSFLTNLPNYDHIFSTKSSLQKRLEQSGTPSTSWLPFATTELHYGQGSVADVVRWHGAQERCLGLGNCRMPGIEQIYGNSWNGINQAGRNIRL